MRDGLKWLQTSRNNRENIQAIIFLQIKKNIRATVTEASRRLCICVFKDFKKKGKRKIISNNNLWSHLLALAHEISLWFSSF